MSIRSRLQYWKQRQARKRRSARLRRNGFCQPLLEQLEDRRMLSVSTPVLGSSNDVVFIGNAGTDAIEFSASSGGLLTHDLGGSFGFNSNSDLDSLTAGDQTRLISSLTSLSYLDSGVNDSVTFGGTNAISLAAANLTVDAGTILVDPGSTVASGDGVISLTADRNIVLGSGSSLTTVDGGIKLNVNANGTAIGDFVALDADGATIQTTGTGDIALTAIGSDHASQAQRGVQLVGSNVSSTSTGTNAGTITIDGTGGDGTSGNFGVLLWTGTSVTSVDGAIAITGEGGNGASSNYGVNLVNMDTISSTGTGANAATISIDGTGGNGSSNHGVQVSGTTTDITSVDGAISITGQGGGNGASSTNYGVYLTNFEAISSTGTTAGAATITINGTGGDGTSQNYGARLSGTSTSAVTSVNGDISITGQGGDGTSSSNMGVYVSRADILSSGTSVDAATITIDGTGGAGASGNYGVALISADTNLSSVAGDISIVGTAGNGSGSNNRGINMTNSASIVSTGVGGDAAMISLNGAGGNGTIDNIGVNIGGSVASVDGAISILGTGGTGSNSGNDGVSLSGLLTSTGVGALAATITINGTGGAGGGDGLFLSGNTSLMSAEGAISLTGQGGNGSGDDNIGVNVVDIDTIVSTGVGVHAASITIDGTGGAGAADNYGVYIQGTATDVTSVDGDISITGQGGGDGSDRYNYGVYVNGIDSISSTGASTGAAKITVDGTGGNGTISNDGVYFAGASTHLTSVIGDILVTGQADNGSGVRLAHGGTSSTGTGADAATLTVTSSGIGTAGSINAGTIISVVGDISVIGGNDSNTSATLATSTGTGTNAATITITNTGTGGNISGSAASVNGNIVIAGGTDSKLDPRDVSSTGTGADAATITILGGAIFSVGSDITSIDGDIAITGTGRNNISTTVGLFFRSFTISSTGVDANAATITIDGTGSSAAARSEGVLLRTGSVTSVAGAISITGQGAGTGASSTYDGVYLDDAQISSTGTGTGTGAATININGTAGNGTTGNDGVFVKGSNAAITSVDGAISIVGRGGNGSGNNNYGVNLSTIDAISSTGTGANAATITIDGTGGDGTDNNYGVYAIEAPVTSVDGAISITGKGGDGSSLNNYGIRFLGNQISSTGTGANAATITLDGAGGNGSDHNYGVEVRNGSIITSVDGAIAITGQGGDGGWGIGTALNTANISSTGTGADAATITVVGNGGNSGTNNRGVQLDGSTSVVTSVAGDISITGQGGVGSQGYGILASNFGTISSAGTGSDAAAIALSGIGTTTNGLHFASGTNAVTSVDGDITLSGQTAAGSDVYIPTIVGGPTATGDITINADSLCFCALANVQSTGALTFKPRTPSTTIGIGGAPGALSLGDTNLSYLADGFSSITIGDINNGTGTVNIDTATFTDPVVIAGGIIHDNAGTDIGAGTNSVTLIGTVSPGQSPGILTVAGNFVFADNDTFDVEIGGATPGTAATNHDQLDVTGTVTIGANVTLIAASFGGFTPSAGQQYVVIDNDTTDAISGTFAGLPEGTRINNFLGSAFDAKISYLGTDAATGNDVVVSVVPTASTLHWQGDVDNNWSTAGNWLEGQVPIDDDSLVFDTATSGFADNFSPVNDLADLRLGSVAVVDNSTVGDFSISGNAIELDADGGDAINANSAFSFAIDITLQSPGTLSGSIKMTGDIDTNDHLVTFDVAGTPFLLYGSVLGTGGLRKTSAGQLILFQDNDYEGLTLVENGGLFVVAGNDLGDLTSGTVVSSGGWISLNSLTTNEPITVEGLGSGGGALGGAGTAEFAGPITLSDDTTVFVGNPGSTLTFSGGITGPGQSLDIQTAGEVSRTLVLDGNNTYTGNTTLLGAGTLLVNGSLALTSTVVIPSGGVLGGSGTIGGLVDLASGATVAPGTSSGILTARHVNFVSGSIFDVELNGANAGSGHDQLKVTGAVSLYGATLNTSLGYVPAPGEEFIIVDNAGTEAVAGTFAGLPEGAIFGVNGTVFAISYQAGDGNDITLTNIQRPPVATDDTATTDEDVALSVDVLHLGNPDNDPNPGDTTSITRAGSLDGSDNLVSAQGGTLVIDKLGTPADPTDDVIVFTPALDFNGIDTFFYTIADSTGLTDTAQVTITVTPVNDPPQISVDSTSAVVNEGATGVQSGTFSDPDSGDTIILSASVGTVTDNGDGTWGWSFDTTDGPDESQIVVITASDDNATNSVDHVTFDMIVNNVAPTATLSGPVSALVNQELIFTISATDPSPADEAAGFLYTKHFDPRFPARNLPGHDPAGVTTTLSFPSPGTFVVTFTATDDDGGATTVTQTVVVSEPTPTGLQNVVDEIITSGVEPMVAVATTTEIELDAMITAIEGITLDLDPEDPPIVLVLDLSGRDYAGKEISVPEGIIVTIENGTLTGASPALIVSGGIVIAENVTFTNSTSAPTILVTGGSLKVRGSFIHETDGGDEAAVEITRGTVDLGTVTDAGGNAVIIHGAGLAIRNLSTNPVQALGNTFEIDGNALTSGYQIENVVDHALDNSGVGLVIWESDTVYVTPGSGSVQRGVDAIAENGRVNVQAGFDKDYDADGKLLTVAYQDGVTLIAQLNPFDATIRELVVIGTEGRDKIDIKEGDVEGAIEVKIKEKGRDTRHLHGIGKFKVKNEHGPIIDRVVVYGLGGDDDIKVHKKVGAIPTELYGGEGDDKLRGGAGDDYLSGGLGDDVLSGKDGRDVMIGGLGKDKIDGDDGDDILVGGVYIDSENRASVHAVMSEWTRTDLDYAARVDHLLNGGGLNGSFVLNATTVFDDNAKDKLKGKKGLDWFFADDDDDKTDLALDELLTDIELDFVNGD